MSIDENDDSKPLPQRTSDETPESPDTAASRKPRSSRGMPSFADTIDPWGVLKHMPSGILICNLAGDPSTSDLMIDVVWINPAASRLFDLKKVQLPIALSNIWPDLTTGQLREDILQIPNSSRHLDRSDLACPRTGASRTLRARIASPSPNQLIIIFEDITEKKSTEKKLRASQSRLRALAEAAYEGMVLHEGPTITEVNRAFANMFGYTPVELRGSCLGDLIVQEQQRPESQEKWGTWGARPKRFLARHRDGTTFPVSIRGRKTTIETGMEGTASVFYDLSNAENARTMAKSQSRLEDQALRDSLTGLYNRRYFDDALERELARAKRFKQRLSLIMLDIDHFKSINDTSGHEEGDTALVAVAQAMLFDRRESDLVARWGGEEFIVLLPDTAHESALLVAERIRQRIQKIQLEIREAEVPLTLTVSAGVASLPEHGRSAAALRTSADAALYASKQAGRNQVTSAHPTRKKKPSNTSSGESP